MLRRCSIASCLLLVTLAHNTTAATAVYPNRLGNPGFENLKDGKLSLWAGAMESVADAGAARSGKRCVRLVAKASGAAHVVSMRSNARRLYYTADARHRFSIWAKGTGELRLGYDTARKQPKGSPYTPHMWQRTGTKLTAQWQQITHDFDILDPYSARCMNVCVELRGEGAKAFLDDASLDLAPPAAKAVTVYPGHGMVAKGQTIDIETRVLVQGKPITTGAFKLMVHAPDGSMKSADIEIAKSGSATYTFAAPADLVIDENGATFYRFLVLHPESGETAFSSVEVVSEETYSAFERVARKVKLPAGRAHFLFIGDSLSDMSRGFNYADKVGFWLRKCNGPRVTYRNVGVGGDYITRVWQRLNAEPRVYRLHAYERIFDQQPTHALIFLGHNDSKVNSKSGIPCVPRDRFAKEFPLAIKKIQADTKAKVIVMSASSSVYEVTSKNWPVWARTRKRGFSKFGIPEVMEEFNAMMRAAATVTGAEYLDVYEPTKAHADKPSLFTGDGVHMNNKGNRFVALEILKHLGKE